MRSDEAEAAKPTLLTQLIAANFPLHLRPRLLIFAPLTTTNMENWEEDFAYQRVRHLIQERFNRPGLPNMDVMLFLIGVQELGRWKEGFTKEEKQDLMHIAVCRLFAADGHYEFIGRDDEGWPHYKLTGKIPPQDLAGQETILKRKIVAYFAELEAEEGLIG